MVISGQKANNGITSGKVSGKTNYNCDVLLEYFNPISRDLIPQLRIDGTVGKQIRFNDGSDVDLDHFQIALIGLGESANIIRKHFYQLSDNIGPARILDLGNLRITESEKNNGFGLTQVIQELHNEAIVPVIMGEESDMSYYQYIAYENERVMCEVARIEPIVRLDDKSTLRKIILHQPNYLFNVTSIGVQMHYISTTIESYMNEMCFDVMRLGQFRDAPYECEPYLRSADIFSFDLSSIQANDVNFAHKQPSGLTGDEACRIARYAGISNQISSAYFYGLKVTGKNAIGAELYAQLLWYFIQGYMSRRYDDPEGDLSNFTVYNTPLMNGKYHLKFLKSHFSERWWLQIDDQNSLNKKFISCSYSDYVKASRDELPDRWWKAYQKLM